MKRLLPLITALILALYVTVPGELNARHDLAGAAVAELQDEVAYASPKQDDHFLVPAAAIALRPDPTGTDLPATRVERAIYRPSVPNIRDPPPCAAV